MADGKTFAKGTLWSLARAQTERALTSGALQPIETSSTHVDEGGVRFSVRVVGSLRKKDEVRKALTGEGRESGEVVNPFLPHDPQLFVTNISETHHCLLNKFPVLDDHLLILTKAFEHQRQLLSLEDFRALWRCMAECDCLGFYNGGEAGGASQPHKHLQLVPLPIAADTPKLPISDLVARALFDENTALGRQPVLPFRHGLARLDDSLWMDLDSGAEAALELYRKMLLELDVAGPVVETSARQKRPYNLLVTRAWMMAVPRSKEFAEGVSINAVGFAGGLLVRNQEQLELVKRSGPMSILARVGERP